MTTQTPDNGRETSSFKIADQKIEKLLRRLNDKRVCPCCTARALARHAASLAEYELGTVEAIELFEGFISQMRESDIPAPESSPSAATH
jgi:hypothetical protein